MTDPQPLPDACSILIDGADAITARANQRDQPNGERSMARTVNAFNAMFGTQLTEPQGWQFMQLLKMARSSAGAHHLDDYTDGAAYCALAGESAALIDIAKKHTARDSDTQQAAIDTVRNLLRDRHNTRRDP